MKCVNCLIYFVGSTMPNPRKSMNPEDYEQRDITQRQPDEAEASFLPLVYTRRHKKKNVSTTGTTDSNIQLGISKAKRTGTIIICPCNKCSISNKPSKRYKKTVDEHIQKYGVGGRYKVCSFNTCSIIIL